ncbi:MAG TPA: hypothetical protein VKX46_04840, partial [Ktedonobacteraceae bacterium]|nr:hypothetical protein [Ktedonobacteraceae bacterium]
IGAARYEANDLTFEHVPKLLKHVLDPARNCHEPSPLAKMATISLFFSISPSSNKQTAKRDAGPRTWTRIPSPFWKAQF